MTSCTAETALPFAVSHDAFLGGRMKVQQPAKGYRAGVDAVILAAAARFKSTAVILDAGCGVGTVALALAARVQDCTIHGIEKDPDLVQLARLNTRQNGFDARIQIVHGDIQHPPPEIPGNGFDHVVCNPPYFSATRHNPSTDQRKATARTAGEGDLIHWMRFCLSRLRPGGSLTAILRADRMPEVLQLTRGNSQTVFPLWPKPGVPPKLLLIQVKKGAGAPFQLLPGLVMHNQDGSYTPPLEKILRTGAPLEWTPS